MRCPGCTQGADQAVLLSAAAQAENFRRTAHRRRCSAAGNGFRIFGNRQLADLRLALRPNHRDDCRDRAGNSRSMEDRGGVAMRGTLKAKPWSFPVLLGVDLVLLHLCMFFALTSAAVYHLATGDSIQTPLLLAELRECYLLFSAAISPVFLLVLWMNGFYSKKLLNLSAKQRLLCHARSIGYAILISIAWDYFV